MLYRSGSNLLRFSGGGLLSDGSGSSDITPSLIVEYVDDNGVLQTTPVVDGVTTIYGTAPFMVKFDATDTRAPTAYAAQSEINDERAHACWAIGYRINYGENLGGTWTWPYSTNYSRDEDTGPPLFFHLFTTTGTKNVRLRCRDALGNEATISLNVVVSEPATTVHIPISQGSWPTFASNTRYTLDAGGDYTSFGLMTFQNRHNVIIEKVGTGADPIISEFKPDSRDSGQINDPPANDTMSRGLRLVDIDVVFFNEGLRSYRHVSFLRGTVRRWVAGALDFVYDNNANATGRTNLRYPRGMYMQETTLRNTGNGNGYAYIGVGRDYCFKGCDIRYNGSNHTQGNTHLILRLYGSHHVLRYNRFFMESSPPSPSACGTVCSFLSLSGTTDETWQSHDRLGPNDAGFKHSYGGEYCFMHANQVYDTGSAVCNGISSTGGNPFESDAPNALTWPELMGWEDNVFANLSPLALLIENLEAKGRWVASRNNRKQNGTVVSTSTGAPNSAASPPDFVTYNGPYLVSDTNNRPVPTSF